MLTLFQSDSGWPEFIPIGTPNLACGEGEDYSVKTAQLWYSMAMAQLNRVTFYYETAWWAKMALR